MELLGRSVKKTFQGLGTFSGIIDSFDPSSGFFKVLFEDGDWEELEFSEVISILDESEEEPSLLDQIHEQTLGRKPKERHLSETKSESDSGNSIHTQLKESGFGEGFDGQDSKTPEKGCDLFEGNLVGNSCSGVAGGTHMEESQFGEDSIRNASSEGDLKENRSRKDTTLDKFGGNLKENDSLGVSEETQTNNFDLEGGFGANTYFCGVLEGNGSCKHAGKNQINNVNFGGNLKGNSSLGISEETQVKEFGLEGNFKGNAASGAVEEIQVEESGFEVYCDGGASFSGNLGTQMKCSDPDGILNENTSFVATEVTQMNGFSWGGDCKESASFNGNLNENVFSRAFEGTQMKVDGFDRHLKGNDSRAVAEKAEKDDNCGFDGCVKVNVAFGVFEGSEMTDCGSNEFQMKMSGSNLVFRGTPLEGGTAQDIEEHGRQKRRKLSEKIKSTSVRELRRSARRATATLLSSQDPVLDTNKRLSDINVVSDSRQSEEQNHISLKPELPPSSNNLNIDDLPVLDLFSVYACLRSFSTVLFLSPFSLEAFVAALRCNFANSLIDSVHLSILQALKLHLELLADEGSQSASDCLRSLNWDLLDLITWPIYLAEYLLIHGSGFKLAYSPFHLKLLDGEYHKQSGMVKLEILRYLCDDVIEGGAIRLELNRRTRVSELDMDTDRSMNIEMYSKRKDSMEDLGNSCLTQEDPSEVADRNSDECCLCKMDGNLLCCDGCPAAYHSRCIGVTKDLLPEGDWYCPECMIDRHDGGMKLSKPLQGAMCLGIDPHGRIYFGSFGYLLVSESCDSKTSNYYYNRNDLSAVIKVLNSSDTSYGAIISAVTAYQGILEARTVYAGLDFEGKTCDTDLSWLCPPYSEQDNVKQVDNDEKKPKEDTVMHEVSDIQGFKASEPINRLDSTSITQSMEAASPFARIDVSVMSQTTTCIPVSENKSLELQIPEGAHSMNEELAKKPNDVDQEKHMETEVCASVPVTIPSKQDTSQLLVEPDSYINYYSLGQIASFVAEELTHRSSDNTKEDSKKAPEDVISVQLKAISKKSTICSWSGIHKLYVDVKKENCGWCFSCKNPSDIDCLFQSMDEKAPEGSKIGHVDLCSNRNKDTHLSSLIYHILSIEERLRGLLSGPWENPHYSRQWRKSILKASDFSSVKPLLLILESNLRRIALSTDWLKHEDSSVVMGSGSLVFKSSVNVASKNGVKKRARKNSADAESSLPSRATSISSIYWWRGGRVSRQVFHWKVLSRSLAFKCARQAGCRRIPGILYPDGSEFSKRSKYVAWRAAVEMSVSVAQLAFQVRDLEQNIRWLDLWNTQFSRQLSRESTKLARLFKKVIIRRKCIEGSNIKYLLDFGRRKTIPDVVIKHGIIEEPSNERKKFWLNESSVPLYLLRSYEEKRQARKASKTEFRPIYVDEGKMKKPSRKKGFSYLFSRAEKYEDYKCGQCNKEVVVREAVNCQICKGYFHKKHTRASKSSVTAKYTFTCYGCQDEKHVAVKKKTKRQKVHVTAKANKKGQKVRAHDIKIPELRRSQRAIKKVSYVPGQTRKLKRRMKGGKFKSESDASKKSKFPSKSMKLKKPRSQSKCETPKESKFRPEGEMSKKSKNGIRRCKQQRTCVYHSYWLKGLLWAKKPCDGCGNDFQERKILVPSQPSGTSSMQPVCCLCHEEYDSSLIYVSCESCEEWFHGDAFGLTKESSDKLLGFKCPNCLERRTPVCPHTKDCVVSKFQIHEEEHYENGVGCVRDTSEEDKIPSEIHEGQESATDKDCPVIHSSDECEPVNKRQRVDAVLDSNETVLLRKYKAESGNICISVGPHVEANFLSCQSDGQDGMQIGVVSTENKLEGGLKEMAGIPELLAVATLELHPRTIFSSTHLLDSGSDKL